MTTDSRSERIAIWITAVVIAVSGFGSGYVTGYFRGSDAAQVNSDAQRKVLISILAPHKAESENGIR